MAKKKNRTKKEKEHLEKLVELGCIVCLNEFEVYSLPEIHHIRSGQGAAQRSDDSEAIGLCHPHHRTGGPGVAIHAGQKTWQAKFGTERELLAKTKTLLGIEDEQFND
ncbi:Ref family recombination enhancement nuclease [Serratia sp. MF2]|uniref:Ref family recombination enhancement nuclease n=1 Tax=Serratia sp. MF2 TaxID=3059173 RepID=UPI0027E755AC|nr:Ref family recombination enhancement nuclease [Serratia sp. MF2]MDQ7101923.1 Ref family recombination enhancement nuclease [Serratia sp. MF2]